MPMPDLTGSPRRQARDRAMALRLEAELLDRLARRRPYRPGDAAAPIPAPRGPGPLPLTGAAALDLPD